jgi:hypothetical protein
MRAIITHFAAVCMAALIFTACKKETKQTEQNSNEISQEVLSQIKSLGFGTSNVRKDEDGYLVEGDILLTPDFLSSSKSTNLLRVGSEEQYRTFNLVTDLPRVITVSTTGLGQAYINGALIAIDRYNALGTGLTFRYISSGRGDIIIRGFNQPPSGGYITLGSAGFPDSKGDPYGTIKMNTNQYAYGSNPDKYYVGSVIQHEIGHCIGFRHTDFMNRSFSCGGSPSNEGSGNIGAVLIPGTPSGPDANSWMLACSNGGDRTFNSNDRTAMNYLY